MMQMEMRLDGGGPLRAARRRRVVPRSPVEGEGQLGLELKADQPLPDCTPKTGPDRASSLKSSGDGAQGAEVRATLEGTSLKAERGRRGYHTGLAAEENVARHYARSGRAIEARRWRGPGGEIDMIVREGERLVFVEVKASRSFDAAISHLTRRQMDRICRSAEAYCGDTPGGLLTEMRFDLALVDGRGAVRVVENAFDGG